MKKFKRILHIVGLSLSLIIAKFKVIMLVLSFFLAKASFEDWIDRIFPNEKIRMAVAVVGIIFFGYHVFVKNRKW